MKISSLAALKVVIFPTFSVVTEEIFTKFSISVCEFEVWFMFFLDQCNVLSNMMLWGSVL